MFIPPMRKLKSHKFREILFHTLLLTLLALLAGCSPAIPSPLPSPTARPGQPEQQAALPLEQRVDELLAQMSLAEKIGQMTLVEKDSIRMADISKLSIGGLLSGGGGSPPNNTAADWAKMVDGFQAQALKSRLGIPLLYGVDAVHGHNNLVGAVIFPHNIGLGAANDPELMTRIGRATAEEMIATGIYWDYAPTVTVPQDIRWGRTYEGYSERTDRVSTLGAAYLHGLQGDDLSAPDTVLATPKHFVGDGGTRWGTSQMPDGYLDRGVTDVDEATLRAVHLPPYIAAIDAGAQSIMVSFSSWGGKKMHAQEYLLTQVLKGELGFEGFLVSDWAGIDEIDPDYYQAVVAAINAGVDMNMVPYDYERFIQTLTRAVNAGDVPIERIDNAVRRILRVKLLLGLFEHPYSNAELLSSVGSDEHRTIARQAVSKSLVLLKNEDNLLPLSKDMPALYIGGQAADDIGLQSGGWTIEWQGAVGDITPGDTILEAIQQTVSPNTTIEYSEVGQFKGLQAGNATCLAVVGEEPYAEWQGDSADLQLPPRDVALVEQMRSQCGSLAVILLSGRPLVITDLLPEWDAFVAAWLPGTEGLGVADVLFGDQPFSGQLPYTWPRSVDQLPFDFENLPGGADGPLFPFGYSLATTP